MLKFGSGVWMGLDLIWVRDCVDAGSVLTAVARRTADRWLVSNEYQVNIKTI
ncbi:hypothetical protein J2W96_007894 [Variovorax guangxiensis]|nr:hypothetical protein [Variovorax guangxiensis]